MDKHFVGGRRFGASVICKDNLVFGIREDADKVKEKVAFEDELPNLETKKQSKRDCDFWLEFENKSRLHVSIVEANEPFKELIPPQNPDESRTPVKRAEIGTADQDIISDDGKDSQMSPGTKSGAPKSSVAGGSGGNQPDQTDKQTMESKKDPAEEEKITEGKTVTINAS